MVPDSCVVARLTQHNLEIVFPTPTDIEEVHRIIVDELTVNLLTTESKQIYIDIMQRLLDEQQVEGIILGCTGKSNTIKKYKISFNQCSI